MKKKSRSISNICVALFFIVCVIAPLLSMLSRITPDGIQRVVSSPQFLPAVWNSISTAAVATVASVLLALLAAWSLERTSIKGKALFGVLFTLPMLIPSISHALGLVALWGKNGILTNLFRLDVSIYGFGGIVIGSIMYSFPVAFLMLAAILRYEDGAPYRAATILGVPSLYQFRDISLPYMRRTILSAGFAVFTMIITDYGVPLMVRGKRITLSVLMYDKAVSLMDYDAGSTIGALLLLPAVAAFLVDIMNQEKPRNSFVSEPVIPRRKRVSNLLASFFCGGLALCVIAPIIAFCLMAFQSKYPIDTTFTLRHVLKTIHRGADVYLFNSVLYALLAAIFGTVLAFSCAYMTSRLGGRFSTCLHLVAITSMAIPGIVLGLSYVIFFHDSPIYGTVLIVVMVNAVHFFSSPYLMIYHTLEKLNPNLEAVGLCMGVKRVFVLRDVILPKVRGTLCEMFTYFFVNSMMTISAVSFLVPPSPKPVSLMINQFESQRLLESASFVSLLILGINLLVKGGFSSLHRFRARKQFSTKWRSL